MSRLVVVSSPGLADGFRLAGTETIAARGGTDARGALEQAAGDPDVGLVLVTSDLWGQLDERLKHAAERLARPIVLPIPAGTVTDVTARRQLLGEMLERAIGYRIELGGPPEPGGEA
jgi:vacuolar-type H+-ATPase subunit F/Vma7